MMDIRNLIDLVSNSTTVNESRGLGARKAGEEFVSTTNPEDKIYIDTVVFYPQGGTGYPTYQDTVTNLEQMVKGMRGAYVDLIGKFKQTDRAFGIATFKKPTGEVLAWVKPYKEVKPDPTQNLWDNQTGIPGYRYNSKSAVKTQAGLTPQDILADKNNLNAGKIIQQIAGKLGENSIYTQAAKAVASGQKFPISLPAPQGGSFTAFRDYFCELLHPIALQAGLYTGNAGQAAERFLGNQGFAKCTINFGTDKTEGLSDSILIAADGRKIKVSSKGSAGAEASSRNLLDAANELSSSDPALAKKHADVIALIQDIVKGGQAGAPLILGIRFGFITKEDADDIQNFKKLPPTNMAAVDAMGISENLKKLIKARNTDNPNNLNLYFHSIASVAHPVAEYINNNTKFSAAASEILNNGALIQVYTTATESDGNWVLQGFNTVWPSSTVSEVKFSASKTYYSTGIKGNFTFKIKRGAPRANESVEITRLRIPEDVFGRPRR